MFCDLGKDSELMQCDHSLVLLPNLVEHARSFAFYITASPKGNYEDRITPITNTYWTSPRRVIYESSNGGRIKGVTEGGSSGGTGPEKAAKCSRLNPRASKPPTSRRSAPYHPRDLSARTAPVLVLFSCSPSFPLRSHPLPSPPSPE